MCTLTIIPMPSGVRLMINRDELVSRPAARPPLLHEHERGVRSLHPTDVRGGGTWVAVTDLGLMFALLNGNPRPMPPLPPREQLLSRGLVIPSLIDARSPGDAASRLHAVDLVRFAPFRFVAADGSTIIDGIWNRAALHVTERPISPTCFVSSGLGDHLVPARVDLFKAWSADGRWTPERQDEFHHHRWPERPEISVLMNRAGARTVSITTVESPNDGEPTMKYADDAGERSISFDQARPAIMVDHRERNTRGPRATC